MSVITPSLAEHVSQWTGIRLVANRQPILEDRLQNLIAQHQISNGDELCLALKRSDQSPLREKFLSVITINETLWFRDSHPFEAIGQMTEELIREKGRAHI